MHENYQDFMNYWKLHLKNTQSIFGSINVYNVLRYLKVFWDSNTKGKNGIVELRGFEKILVRALVRIIGNESLDFRIIYELDACCAVSLSNDIMQLSKKGLDDNSMRIIDRILKLCHEERFKREMFYGIFNSTVSAKDSIYLTDCLLRILVEEHSIDFLNKLPLMALIRYVLERYGQQIILALDRDFENHIKIFDNVHKFTREKLFPMMDDIENFRAQNMTGKYSIQLKPILEYVVNYLREQIKYNTHIIKRKKWENNTRRRF